MSKKTLVNLIIVLVIMTALSVVLYLYFPKILGDTLFPLEYKDLIMKYSTEYNLEPTFVAGVMYTESHFNKDATSRVGARGLMQIMPATGASIAKRVGDNSYNVDKLFDPETNIRYGSWYLRYLMDNYGEINAVLAGYNGGGAVGDRYVVSREAGIPNETKGFIRKVNFAMNMYASIYGENLGGVNVADKLRVKQDKPSDR